MEIGIIGLPNVGKSTLFNALTELSVPVGNYPFTTTDKNTAIVNIPDERLTKLADIFKPKKLTPAVIKFIDIAGLVRGAHQGLGLGNKFLSYIREVDAILHVIRCFDKKEVVNLLERIDPEEEKKIVETELIYADLETAEKMYERLEKKVKKGDKESIAEKSKIEDIIKKLNDEIPIRNQGIPPEEIKEYNFLTCKPILYVLNVDEHSEKFEMENSIRINVKLEEELLQLTPDERKDFLSGFEYQSCLEKLIKASFNLLNKISFYTVVGGREIRAWVVDSNTTAKEAAGKIHSDMEMGFICAEVYNFSELLEHGSEKEIYEKGIVRTEGKDYRIKDGDIIRIKFKK